jgi:hypothetical protein
MDIGSAQPPPETAVDTDRWEDEALRLLARLAEVMAAAERAQEAHARTLSRVGEIPSRHRHWTPAGAAARKSAGGQARCPSCCLGRAGVTPAPSPPVLDVGNPHPNDRIPAGFMRCWTGH